MNSERWLHYLKCYRSCWPRLTSTCGSWFFDLLRRSPCFTGLQTRSDSISVPHNNHRVNSIGRSSVWAERVLSQLKARAQSVPPLAHQFVPPKIDSTIDYLRVAEIINRVRASNAGVSGELATIKIAWKLMSSF